MLAQRTVQSPRQAPHEPGELGLPEDAFQLFVHRLRSSDQQVAAQGVVEDVGVLRDDGELASQGLPFVATDIAATEPYLSGRGIPEAQGEVNQRALSRAARSDHRDPAAGHESEVNVLQNERTILLIVEAYPVELKGM